MVELFIYFTPFCAQAQYFTGAVASGTGGAGVASAEVSESTFLNPAMVAHSPEFSSGIFYQDGWRRGLDHSTDLGFNLVDNSEGLVLPGAIGHIKRRIQVSGSDPIDEKYFQIVLGGFASQRISVGMTLFLLQSVVGGEEFEEINGHLGFFLTPHPDVGIGLVFYNLASAGPEIPSYLQQLSKSRLGVNWILTEFVRLRLDVAQQLKENPGKDLEVMTGMETYLNKFLVLRLGWKNDGLAEEDFFSTGMSFVGPRFSLDYTYLQDQQNGSRGPLHSVDLRMPL